MSDIIHMTAANTVELLKMTQSKTRPSEAAVIAGRREPYHLTYIKKYGYTNQNRAALCENNTSIADKSLND